MTAGLTTFREVAVALEVPGAIGVPVSPATVIIPGVTRYDTREQRTKYRPTTLNGTAYPYRSTTSTFAFAPQRFEAQASAEALPYILGMALRGAVSGVSDADPTPRYRWRYRPTGNAEDAPDLRTFYAKDTSGNFQYPSTFGTNFTLGGRVDEAFTVQSDLVGQKEVWPSGVMGSPAEIDPFHPFPFAGLTQGRGGLYIDGAASGVPIGTTRFPGCLRSVQLSFDSFMYHRCQALYYTDLHQRALNPRLQLEMEVNSRANDSLSLLAPFKADQRLVVRLLVVGPRVIRTVTAPGAAPTVGASGAGATLAAGSYMARYTWVTEAGESPWSAESAPQAVTLGQTLDVTVPAFPVGVIGWNLYLTPPGGGAGTETGPQNAAPYTGVLAHFGTPYVAKAAAPLVNGATVNDVLQVDYVGQILEPSVIGSNNADGVETVTFTLESEPDVQVPSSGYASGVLDISVYNAMAALL